MTEPRVIAEFSDYSGFLAALRMRANERQIAISGDEVHHVAGLSDRRIAQMLSVKTLQRVASVRRVGMLSLGPLLGVLGVKLVMVEDAQAVARYGSRLKKRNENLVHSGVVHRMLTRDFYSKIGKNGGSNSRKYLGKRARRRLARKAASVRWQSVMRHGIGK